jgi:hypothetical protein
MGAHHFGVAMGADAQAQAAGVDGGQVRAGQRVQVFLAHMDAVGAGVDGFAPVVVDEQAGVGALDGCNRCALRHGWQRRCRF